jgi:hypothetical protein
MPPNVTDPATVMLLYHRPTTRGGQDVATIAEQVAAFPRHSRFAVCSVNTDFGFPSELAPIDVGAVVMHHSLLGAPPYKLDDGWLDWLHRSQAYKICFFSDEHAYCRPRRAFIDELPVDCVYSHVEPQYTEQVYGRCARPPHVVHHIAGYVTEEVREAARRFSRPDAKRRVDVGYRGRDLPAWMGRGAREKVDIAVEFERRVLHTGLVLDIDAREEGRLYGAKWHRFLGDCRSMLGVESGTSYMDLEDEVWSEHLATGGDHAALPEALARWEGNIPYRTLATRHFEAAAFGACQILFEGRYSDVMQPMVHYLPLRKDFGNLAEVLAWHRDEDVRSAIVHNARRDLIDSRAYDVSRLVARVDRTLEDEAGLRPRATDAAPIRRIVRRHARRRRLVTTLQPIAASAGARVYRRTPEIVLRRLRAGKERLAARR